MVSVINDTEVFDKTDVPVTSLFFTKQYTLLTIGHGQKVLIVINENHLHLIYYKLVTFKSEGKVHLHGSCHDDSDSTFTTSLNQF